MLFEGTRCPWAYLIRCELIDSIHYRWSMYMSQPYFYPIQSERQCSVNNGWFQQEGAFAH